MSRRIAICALAAALAVIAAPAQADRECFENSCRMPDVIEPPPVSPQAAPQASAAGAEPRAEATHAEASQPPQGPAPHAQAPALPQTTSDPAVNLSKAAPRHAAKDIDVGPPRFPTPPAPRYPKPAAAPAKAMASAHVPARSPRGAYAAVERAAPADVVVVRAGVAPAYAVVAPDPAWKVCQIDAAATAGRIYYCGPHSYHPYGAHGYRPYGSYRSYRTSPAYVLAPDAKVISIDSGD